MPRPTKHENEKLSEVVRLRVTVAEHAHIREQAEAAGVTVSDYLRRRAVGYRVPSAATGGEGRRVDPALITAVNKIGVNVNQLARAVHTDRSFVEYWREIGAEVESLLARLVRDAGEA